MVPEPLPAQHQHGEVPVPRGPRQERLQLRLGPGHDLPTHRPLADGLLGSPLRDRFHRPGEAPGADTEGHLFQRAARERVLLCEPLVCGKGNLLLDPSNKISQGNPPPTSRPAL